MVLWLADSATINESGLFNYTARKMRLSLHITSVYLPRLPPGLCLRTPLGLPSPRSPVPTLPPSPDYATENFAAKMEMGQWVMGQMGHHFRMGDVDHGSMSVTH